MSKILIYLLFVNTVVFGCVEKDKLLIVDMKTINDTLKKIVLYEKPILPNSPYNQKIKSGCIQVIFNINELGKAINIITIDSFPKRVFDKTVLKSVERMLFLPQEQKTSEQSMLVYSYDNRNGLSIF